MKATIHGKKGNFEIEVPDSVLTRSQVKKFSDGFCTVTIRYDDSMKNGYNSFGLTVSEAFRGGGCADHDYITRNFPELAHLTKFHGMGSHGPSHYLGNSIYHASDKDCHGKRKGEPSAFVKRLLFIGQDNKPFPLTMPMTGDLLQFIRGNPVLPAIKVLEVPHENENGSKETYKFSPKYTFAGMPEIWYRCPFDCRIVAEQFKEALEQYKIEIVSIPTLFSDGKEPDLEAARRSACWPDAQREDFTEEKLLARLPALLEEFKREVEKLGFIY